MAKKNSNKNRPPVPVDVVRARRRAVLRDFGRFVLLAVAMLALGHFVEDSAFGRQVRIGAYELMQGRLRVDADAELPVVVVGIDELRPETVHDGFRGEVQVTPRAALLELVRAIARSRPLAIGIDVDFSPEDGSYQTARDPEFFVALAELERSTGVRIRLGADRTRGGLPAEWLGDPAFAPLAAAIVVPRAEEGIAVRAMPSGIAAQSRPEQPSLAAAVHGLLPADAPALLRPFVARYREVDRAKERPRGAAVERASLQAHEFLVDFGAVPALLRSTVRAADVRGASAPDPRFAGRYVLLGDVDAAHSLDRFVVPGHSTQLPGVYAHASAVYTLATAPLYELTPLGGFAIDLLLALVSFGAVAAVRLWVAGRVREDFATERVNTALTFATIAGLVVVGHFAVSSLRLVWIGYALVIVVQLLHFALERTLHGLHASHDGSRGARRMPLWKRIFFERGKHR